jgi:cell division septum initiation protein DivIVA
MKTINLLSFALFITITVLLSGCVKTDTTLQAENTDLKARLQKLEQQLKEATARAGSSESKGAQPAFVQELKSQLEEAQKKAEAAATELKALSSQVESQKATIDKLKQELLGAQQAREKAEKALQLYLDKAAAALKEFKALRSTMGGETVKLDNYHQNYLATQSAVNQQLAALPESRVRSTIASVLALFNRVDKTWVAADQLMQERLASAQADYDKFVYAGGLGPHDHLVKIGKAKILGPVEQENAAMVSVRDEQVTSSVKDIDLGIKKLQDMVNG